MKSVGSRDIFMIGRVTEDRPTGSEWHAKGERDFLPTQAARVRGSVVDYEARRRRMVGNKI